jgi:SAM-dependent methyltransferase
VTLAELQELSRAFWGSRAVLTAIELDVFTAVGDGAGAPEVAARIGADPRATEMLLNAVTGLGILTKADGVFHNTAMSAAYLSDGSPESRRAAFMHTVHLWERWSTLTEAVRTGSAVNLGGNTSWGEGWVEPFIAAMHGRAEATAASLVEAIGVRGVRRLLDVGGGSGAYAIAFARAEPALEAEVFDLPQVLTIASRHIQAAGLPQRVRTREGDLRKDVLGEGYDLILVSSICHMLRPGENQDLLIRAFRALAPGGRAVVRDHMMTLDKTAPLKGALFSLNMLTGTEGGAAYSAEEYTEWLKRAGFAGIHQIGDQVEPSLIIGVRPPERASGR